MHIEWLIFDIRELLAGFLSREYSIPEDITARQITTSVEVILKRYEQA